MSNREMASNAREYVHSLFYELYAFMLVSILFLGWELGFQHFCISFTIAIFFCDFYLNKNETAKEAGRNRLTHSNL